MAVDEGKLNTFLGKAVGDLGAAMSAVLVSIGDELGFYKALAKDALTPAELATRTDTNERYVREWLNNQAAGGYVTFDPANGKYRLSEEQALCLADPGGPRRFARRLSDRARSLSRARTRDGEFPDRQGDGMG